jgi:hypothetical protein
MPTAGSPSLGDLPDDAADRARRETTTVSPAFGWQMSSSPTRP